MWCSIGQIEVVWFMLEYSLWDRVSDNYFCWCLHIFLATHCAQQKDVKVNGVNRLGLNFD